MKAYTHVVWDFNGTILDDVALCIRSVNQMLERRQLSAIPDADRYRELFRFPVIEYYRALGFDFAREDYYRVLAPEWVASYLAGENQCDPMPGALETLRDIRAAGIPQVLISATESAQLKRQLERLGISWYFHEILGIDNIHANGKADIVHAWGAAHPDACPLFVGDTEHDAEVAAAIGADCVLYTGGHQSKARLSLLGCPLIDHIHDVCAIVKGE